MKTNCWLILGTMVATTALAQVNPNKLPEIPPPATAAPAAPAPVTAIADTQTNAPVKKAVVKAKKKAVKKAKVAAKAVVKKTADLPLLPVTLVPGPASVAAEHVNLRGQAGLQGEVVGHIKKGDAVTVLSEITLDKPKAGEPAQWAKIALPAGTKVWLDSKYVDATNHVVSAKKLNLRGGPGENFSVLGVIEKGTAITTVSTKGDWTQIETPASAFAFVAASYLKQDGSVLDTNVLSQPPVAAIEAVPPPTPVVPPPAIVPPPVVPPTPTTVTDAQPIAPPAANPPTGETAPVPPPTTPAVAAVAATPPPLPAMVLPAPTLAADADTNLPPPPPRIVTHEGSVRHSVSLVAPTYFELYDPASDKAINYLFTTSTNLNLRRYDGMHITVTGEEAMDARWQDTPVLTIQKIYVLSGAAPAMKKVGK